MFLSFVLTDDPLNGFDPDFSFSSILNEATSNYISSIASRDHVSSRERMLLRRSLVAQDIALNKFFQPTSERTLKHLSRNLPSRPKCDWKAVKCNYKGLVVRMEITGCSHDDPYMPLFDMRWMPATVEDIEIYTNKLRGTISTRHLPQHAKRINLERNNLEGTFDMTGLPPKVEILQITYNRFREFSPLHFLPPEIRVIHFTWDWCEYDTLWYGDLPKSLVEVQVSGKRLKRIRPLRGKGDKSDLRVFNSVDNVRSIV